MSCGFPAFFVEMANIGLGPMKLTRMINWIAMGRVFRRAMAAVFVCATICAPAASLGFSLLPTQGGSNEERSELDGSEHVRAALPQCRRQVRCKPHPACDAIKSTAMADSLVVRQRTLATAQLAIPPTSGWSLPLRL